jgi:hypothetical protein
VLLEVGPVSSHAVLVWIDYAEGVLANVADEQAGDAALAADHVPADVFGQFGSYLRDWRPLAESRADFVWSADVEPEVAEYLVHAFFKLSWRQVRAAGGGTGMPQEAVVFNAHLVDRMLSSLSGEGHAEAEFAEHLRSFWPGLDAE